MGIVYRNTFDDFLNTLPNERRDKLTELIRAFAHGELDVKPRHCKHIPNQDKLLFDTEVVFYTMNGNDMELIGGCVVYDRAA